jgi:hypothetical protein
MTQVEQRLDEFSRAVAGDEHTRKGVLKIGLGVVGAAMASVFTGGALAHHKPGHGGGGGGGGGGSSECAHFCKSFPPGERDDCLHACKGAECAGDPTRICPGPTVRCCAGGPAACCGTTACCGPGQVCCPTQNRCVGPCPAGTTPNPVTCSCQPIGTPCPGAPGNVCPPGTTCCPGAPLRCCPPMFDCCPGAMGFGGCCPPGTNCVTIFGLTTCA